jgi:hypothetical protein
MDAGTAHAHESRFGPPSEPINVGEFIDSAINSESLSSRFSSGFSSSNDDSVPAEESSSTLEADHQYSVAQECRYELTLFFLIPISETQQCIGHKRLTFRSVEQPQVIGLYLEKPRHSRGVNPRFR